MAGFAQPRPRFAEAREELDAARRDLTIKTANGHSYASVNEAIGYLTSGKHPELLEIATHQFPLEQVKYALDTAGGEGEPGAIHVTVLP